jgi:hypothetical protein
MRYCLECKQKLIEIDNRGEHLIGCLTCNVWWSWWSTNAVKLSEEDLHALHDLRRTKTSQKKDEGADRSRRPIFDHSSVTANPDETNWCRSPTWAHAVLPIVTVIPMGMIMVVVMIVVMMVVMIVIVRVMFMIVIVIMPLIVTLLLIVIVLLMSLLLIVIVLLMTLLLTVIVIFSQGHYRKQQSTCYRADEREFANHLVSLCCVTTNDNGGALTLDLKSVVKPPLRA